MTCKYFHGQDFKKYTNTLSQQKKKKIKGKAGPN